MNMKNLPKIYKENNKLIKSHNKTKCIVGVNNDEYENNPYIEKIIAIGSSYKAGLIAEGKADLCKAVGGRHKALPGLG